MMKRLACLVVCLMALAVLAACSTDPYYAITYPGSQFDPADQ